MQREVVIFAGNVQGVGFRHSTWTMARNYDVCGFVRNLPDGRVELVVEGELPEVVRLVADVRERLAHYIRSVTADRQPATGEFSRFEIRY